jgi:KDO2-lipid IV(A) lauroyltransferase
VVRRAPDRGGAGRGRGIVFLTPHLGCFEATAQGYAGRYGRITVLYRPARKAWLRPLVDQARARPTWSRPTTLAGVKQMLKALQAGRPWACCPTRCRRTAWACGRRSSASRRTP